MSASKLVDAVICPKCDVNVDCKRGCCACGHYTIQGNMIVSNVTSAEMSVRDLHASGYLKHSEFPVQMGSF